MFGLHGLRSLVPIDPAKVVPTKLWTGSKMARPAGFELEPFCLEVVGLENLNALSSVASGRMLF